MSFTAQDEKNIEDARSVGLVFEVVPGPPKKYLCRVEIGNNVNVMTNNLSEILSNLVWSQDKFLGDTSGVTYWFEITQKNVPPYLTMAIQNLTSFGGSLVVTHGNSCSLDDINTFDSNLLSVLSGACSPAPCWHPLSNCFVSPKHKKQS